MEPAIATPTPLPLDSQANSALLEMLVDQVDFVEKYFTRQPVRQQIERTKACLPLLDYVYDKQLQFDTNAKALLEEQQTISKLDASAKDLTVERFMSCVEFTMNDNCFIGSMSDVQIKNFRVLYRFRIDNQLHDHTTHYQQSFLPFYRFSHYRNFSRAVGSTMRRNIKRLYDYIRGRVGDEVCPCIVLYNLFIRDNFRLFSLMSMQHFNYVEIVDDERPDAAPVLISYVELTNEFPQISQWFPNINGQYVKKYGPHGMQKLQAYALLMTNRNAADANGCGNIDETVATSRQRRSTTRTRVAGIILGEMMPSGVVVAEKSGGRIEKCMLKAAAKGEQKKQQRKVSTPRKERDGRRSYTGQKRLRLENLFLNQRDNDNFILDAVFRSNYRACKHARIARFFLQLRSGDEAATLVMRCLQCGKRL